MGIRGWCMGTPKDMYGNAWELSGMYGNAWVVYGNPKIHEWELSGMYGNAWEIQMTCMGMHGEGMGTPRHEWECTGTVRHVWECMGNSNFYFRKWRFSHTCTCMFHPVVTHIQLFYPTAFSTSITHVFYPLPIHPVIRYITHPAVFSYITQALYTLPLQYIQLFPIQYPYTHLLSHILSIIQLFPKLPILHPAVFRYISHTAPMHFIHYPNIPLPYIHL